MQRTIGLTLLATTLLIAFSCQKEKAVEITACTDVEVSFATEIAPLIQNNCAFPGCHGDATNSGFTMLNYTEISTQAQNPRLLQAIKHESAKPMPRINPFQTPANMLPDSLILKMECWIANGTPNN
jgi:hypothetical protein